MPCSEGSQRYQSPTSRLTNRLLWGEPSQGEYGLLIRTPDEFESLPQKTLDRLNYVPASFIHASLRSANAVFTLKQGDFGVAFVIGTKYKKNWSMKNFQDDGFVDNPVFYPVDCNSIKRRSLWDINGTGCYEKKIKYHCVDGKCITSKDPERRCACNTEEIPPHKFGEHYTKFLKGRKFEEDRLSRVSCWLPGTHRGWSDMMAASNSYWKERRRRTDSTELSYHGWTEVPVTKNSRDEASIDAILVKLPPTSKQHVSLCDLSQAEQNMIQRRLENMGSPRRGRTMPIYRSLPIIFYAETEGMDNPEECNRVWNGEDCRDGYRKEFFSQRFNFSNGACLYTPPGCKDVYYFRRDEETGSCSAFSGSHDIIKCDREHEMIKHQVNYHLGSIGNVSREEEVYDIAEHDVAMTESRRILEVEGSMSMDWGRPKLGTQETYASLLFILPAITLLQLAWQKMKKAKNCATRKYV